MSASNKKPKTIIGVWLTSFLLIIALTVSGTLAWFVTNDEVAITSPSDENLAVQVNAGDLEISVSYQMSDADHYGTYTEFSEYGQDIKLNVSTPQFIDLTGNGEHLWFPTYLTTSNLPAFTDAGSFEDVTGNVSYCITLKLKFRTSQTMDIYLDDKSFVKGMEDILGDSFVRSSSYGNFSCDGIAGCVRVAFLETDGEEETLKAVWIPNDHYCLTNEVGSSSTFTLNGERESSYMYYDKVGGRMVPTTYSAYDGNLLSTPTYCNGQVIVGNSGLANAATSTVNIGTSLLSFTESGVVQEKELIVRVWFEGTDREADSALDGGKVQYCLSFCGIRKDEVSSEIQEKVNNITYINKNLVWDSTSKENCGSSSIYDEDGNNVKILYSLNGIDWVTYGVNSELHAFPAGTTFVYVRSAETSTRKVSAAIAVPVS